MDTNGNSKEVLTKDLCARLPYYTWVQFEGKDYIITGYGHGRVSLLPSPFSSAVGPVPLVEEVKPYLRPMSSMTEEEFDGSPIFDCCQHSYKIDGTGFHFIQIGTFNADVLDYLNAHHFDYRGLIEKGLAIKAPKGMYK